jgi:hypothetical protein
MAGAVIRQIMEIELLVSVPVPDDVNCACQ